MKRVISLLAAAAMGSLIAGCASYATPGRGADMRAVGAPGSPTDVTIATDPGLHETLGKKPLAAFPTGIAVARVQDSGYRSRTATGYGQGRYSVVTTRDVEKPEHFARLTKLPYVQGVAPVNRLLLPSTLSSDSELRAAAASLHADMTLIYTLDTTFRVDEKGAPLTVFTLGFAPNQRAVVICTASAVLADTRNGYVYGVAEATDKTDQLASHWTSEEAVDESRLRAEARAFDKLVGEVETMWGQVVAQYVTTNASTAE